MAESSSGPWKWTAWFPVIEMSISDLSVFLCQRCGACCRWEGYVQISSEEIDQIADFLGLSLSDFVEQYSRITLDRKSLSLTENEDGSCIFFQEDSCSCLINPVKPRQCRDFPRKWNFPGWDKICRGGPKQE